MSVLLETSLGDIVIDLFWEKAPLACKNFIKLCKTKYYNGALFFDVQKGYLTRVMHEKRPPTSLNNILYGEQAKYFEDQIDPEAKHNRMGTVSTSNVGPGMNDSNFFITLSNSNIESLNGKHTIFGVVAEGVEVLDKINDVYVDEQNRPFKNIRILHTPVLDDPFDDPPELDMPENSPEINYDETDRLDVNDQLDLIEGTGRTEEEVIQETKRHEAKTKAIVLEMLNDLPDAEIKPPDNVLFVCKLNPVTQEDDLETIFSQFGPIKNCEIIRDWKSGASLQYAFIEFETAAACEEAFFKMDNALIDERRIHVDFSQSVAKYWYKYKSGNPIAFKGKGGGGEKGGPGGGSRYNPKLELKSKHTQDNRGGYQIVIDEREAKRESRKPREPRPEPQRKERSPPKAQERKPKSKSRSRSRSKSKERRRDRKPNEDTRNKRRDSRSPRRDRRDGDRGTDREKERGRGDRSEKHDNGGHRKRDNSQERSRQKDREREREREREKIEREREKGREKDKERDRERERAKDKKRDDNRGRRSQEKRKKKVSSSRSSSSSSSSSGSASSSRSSS